MACRASVGKGRVPRGACGLMGTMTESPTKTKVAEGVEGPVPETGPGENPPDLLPIDSYVGHWWVVHTKSRNEKALASDLEKKRIQYFLPLARLKRRYGGRVTQVELPLFPCYLFLCGGEDERYATLMTHRVAAVIPVPDQDRLRTELHHVCRLIMSQEPVDLYPGLKQGCRCRVIRGSLAGLEGVVIRRRDICRVYVGVEVLGQSAELEIDPSLLEVIE
jgi:transcription antitermination factor NusG